MSRRRPTCAGTDFSSPSPEEEEKEKERSFFRKPGGHRGEAGVPLGTRFLTYTRPWSLYVLYVPGRQGDCPLLRERPPSPSAAPSPKLKNKLPFISRGETERKKTDQPNEGWGEDKVPTCTSRVLEGRSGTQGNRSGERIATRRGAGQGSPVISGDWPCTKEFFIVFECRFALRCNIHEERRLAVARSACVVEGGAGRASSPARGRHHCLWRLTRRRRPAAAGPG